MFPSCFVLHNPMEICLSRQFDRHLQMHPVEFVPTVNANPPRIQSSQMSHHVPGNETDNLGEFSPLKMFA